MLAKYASNAAVGTVPTISTTETDLFLSYSDDWDTSVKITDKKV